MKVKEIVEKLSNLDQEIELYTLVDEDDSDEVLPVHSLNFATTRITTETYTVNGKPGVHVRWVVEGLEDGEEYKDVLLW